MFLSWLAEKNSKNTPELVMLFNLGFAFSFEAEDSPFDSGKWEIIGDNLTLTRPSNNPVTYPIKFVSDKVLL
jgi:hypothetical protein